MSQQGSHNKGTAGTTASINLSPEERNFSTVGGTALLVFSLMRLKKSSLLFGPIGANLLYQGLTGRSLLFDILGQNHAVHDTKAGVSVPHQQGIHVSQAITIDRPVDEVYTFWRNFTNLPQFMNNLESVTIENNTRSHWRVKGPIGTHIAWDAEIINDVPNEVIGWRSLPNPFVDHAGSVRFKPAPAERGTEIHVEMEYAPLGGALGAAVAQLFGTAPQRQIWDDLRRLKQYLEAGEIATTDGQPSGRDQEE